MQLAGGEFFVPIPSAVSFTKRMCVMIDVSSLTPLQAAVALLIERRGKAGRRVCEINKELKQGKRAIVLALSHLLDCGVVIRIEGDVPKYYSPLAHIDSPLAHVDSPLAHVDSTMAHVLAGCACTTKADCPVERY